MLLSQISSQQLNTFIEDIPFLGAELVLVGTLLVIVLADLCLKNVKQRFQILTVLFLIGVLISTGMSFIYTNACNCMFLKGGLFTDFTLAEDGLILSAQSPLLYFTKQSVFLKFLMGISTVLLVAFNQFSFKQSSLFEKKSEYYVAILAILLGASLLTSSTHFLMTLIAIEISSFGAYALIYFGGTAKSKEGSLKYILYGLVATALMLFGISWIYMSTGSFGYHSFINSFVNGSFDGAIIGGGILLLAGLLFKLGTIPFHIWIPDAFEGGPTSGVAYLSLVPKIGALSNLILLFSAVLKIDIWGVNFQNLFLVLGVMTMTVGNLFALSQTNIKRLLGYSSIAHSGFLLMAFGIGGFSGFNSLFFYITVYIFMNFLAFICADYFISSTKSEEIKLWSGQGGNAIFVSIIFMVALIALIGLPPTAGFNAKLFVFTAMLELAQSSNDTMTIVLLIISVFNIIISLFYYLKIPFHLFFKKSDKEYVFNLGVLTKLQLSLMVLPLIVLFFA